jgi:predicted kinase
MDESEQRRSLLAVARGLPASGKTTLIRDWVSRAREWRARVNRDDLRDMAHGGWLGTEEQERMITIMQDAIVGALLRAGYEVGVDDTMLDPQHSARLSDVAGRAGARVLFDLDQSAVPVDECVRRNATRETLEEQLIRRASDALADMEMDHRLTDVDLRARLADYVDGVGRTRSSDVLPESVIRNMWEKWIKPLDGGPLPAIEQRDPCDLELEDRDKLAAAATFAVDKIFINNRRVLDKMPHSIVVKIAVESAIGFLLSHKLISVTPEEQWPMLLTWDIPEHLTPDIAGRYRKLTDLASAPALPGEKEKKS